MYLSAVTPTTPAPAINNAALPIAIQLTAVKDALTANYTNWQWRLEQWRGITLGPIELGSLSPVTEISRQAWVNYDKWIKDYVLAKQSDLTLSANIQNANELILAGQKMSSGYSNAYLFSAAAESFRAVASLLTGIATVTWNLTSWAIVPVAQTFERIGNVILGTGESLLTTGETLKKYAGPLLILGAVLYFGLPVLITSMSRAGGKATQ